MCTCILRAYIMLCTYIRNALCIIKRYLKKRHLADAHVYIKMHVNIKIII